MTIITLIDAIWITVALVGIGVSTWALVDSRRDDAARRKSGLNGWRKTVVIINLRGAQAGLLLHFFFLILGILSVTATVRPRPSLFYVVVAGGYILVAATNVRAIALNQLDRLRIRQG